MRNIVTHVRMRSLSRRDAARASVAHIMQSCGAVAGARAAANAVSDSLDDERSPISRGEGMHNLMTRITTALFEYVKDLVRRAPIASITEWPTHREW